MKPWCSACGWNREIAERERDPDVRVVVYCVGAVFAVCIVLAVMGILSVQAFVLCLVLASLMAALTVPQYLDLRKLKAFASSSAQGRATRPPTTVMADRESAKLLRELMRIPRPRSVRTTRSARFRVGWFLVFGSLVGLRMMKAWELWNESHDLLHFTLDRWLALIVLVAVVWIPARSFPVWTRDRQLLAGGEITIGQVLSQQPTGRHKSGSEILYAFTDAHGTEFMKWAPDYGKSLFEGMPVIVFYDRAAPQRSVARGCSHFELNPRGL